MEKIILESDEKKEPVKVQVGVLRKKWGIKGYHIAQIGHPVYELADRYIITLAHDTLPDLDVPFYKKDLEPAIEFKVTK